MDALGGGPFPGIDDGTFGDGDGAGPRAGTFGDGDGCVGCADGLAGAVLPGRELCEGCGSDGPVTG
jgi:hypothetical protein